MNPLEEMERKLAKLDRERALVLAQLDEAKRLEKYKDFFSKLVKADLARPMLESLDPQFKQEVLQWLQPKQSAGAESTIKGWLLTTIDACSAQLTPADLRKRFGEEFDPHRVASLRQYLTRPFGLVRKVDGKLVLAPKGKSQLKKLKRNDKRSTNS